MVNVQKGILVECDPQMKQFLVHLDETKALHVSFILADLDYTHLFIDASILDRLVNEIDDLMDKINFVEV